MKLFKTRKKGIAESQKFRSSNRNKVIYSINLFAVGILCPLFAWFIYQSGIPKMYFLVILVYVIYFAFSLYFVLVLKKSRNLLTTIFVFALVVSSYFCFRLVYDANFDLLQLIYFLVYYCFSLFLIQRTFALVTFVILINAMLTFGMVYLPEVQFSYSKMFISAVFLTLGICAITIRYIRDEQFQSLKGYSQYLSSILNNPGISYFLLSIDDKMQVVDLNDQTYKHFHIEGNSKSDVEIFLRKEFSDEEIKEIKCLNLGDNFIKNIEFQEFNKEEYLQIIINPIVINSEKYWICQAKNVTTEVIKQKEIIANEKRFRNLYYRNNAGVFTLTTDAILVDANNAFYNLFEDTIPIGSAMYYGSSYQIWIDILDQIEREETIAGYQIDFTLSNGSEKVFVFSWFKDDVTGFIEGTVVDLTAIQNANKVIKQNELKYHTLFEESNDAILLFDKETIIDANKRALHLFSFAGQKSDLIGTKLYRLGADNSKKWKDKFVTIVSDLENRDSTKFDWEFLANGKKIEAEVFISKTILNNESYYQCIIHDNTLKNIHLKQIENNRKNLQNILESNPQGIVIVDNETVVYQNSEAQSLFGEVTQLEELFSGKNRERLKSSIQQKIKKGQRKELQLTKQFKGKEIQLDTSIVATNYQSSEALMLIFNDVTAQKILEKEKLRAELAEESTKKLALEIKERVRAEKKLQEEFLRSKAILESSSNTFLLTVNAQFEISSINSHIEKAAQKITKSKLHQGQSLVSLFEIILNSDQLLKAKRVLNLVRNGKDFEGTINFSIEDNPNIWWEFYLSPIRNINGRVTEISLVAHDVSEKILADNEIMESLKEKEVLLKEIHHRVKNNLQVISSILNLQSSFVKDDEIQDILMESRNRVRTMAIIHENLYRTEDFSSIDFGEYLMNLTRNLVATYRVNRNVGLQLDVDPVKLNIDQAIPCGLLVNEVVSNALKYAWTEGEEGELFVHLNQQENWVHLEISDNGSGLPDEFEKLNSDTLGLQLISTLVEQLDGNIKVVNDNGTKYLIKFERV